MCYLIYQYLQVLSRLGLFVLSVDAAANSNASVTNLTGANRTMEVIFIDPPGSPILLGALFFAQSYVAYFVTRFHCTLPTRADLDRGGVVAL